MLLQMGLLLRLGPNVITDGTFITFGSKSYYRWDLYYAWVHLLHLCLLHGVIQCFYRDFVHWGQQDSVYTNPVIFEIANIVTRIRVDGVPKVFLPGFRTLGSTGP